MANEDMKENPEVFLARITAQVLTMVSLLKNPRWEDLESRARDMGLNPINFKVLLAKLVELRILKFEDGRYAPSPLGESMLRGSVVTKAIYCFGDETYSPFAAKLLIDAKADIVVTVICGGEKGDGINVAAFEPSNAEVIPQLLEDLAKDLRIRLAAGEKPVEAN